MAFGWAAWPWAIAAPSVVTFGLYGYDKRAARRGTWRVPERVLHGLALLGGSPGALLGQRVFRHKIAKRSFQIAFWAIVALQAVAIVLIWRAAR